MSILFQMYLLLFMITSFIAIFILHFQGHLIYSKISHILIHFCYRKLEVTCIILELLVMYLIM
jgi:hypothetical protein